MGFILTRHRKEVAGNLFLEYWLITDDGPVKLVTTPQSEIFFVCMQDEEKIRQLFAKSNIHCQIKPLELRNFQQEPVLGLYFSQSTSAYKAKELLGSENILSYENDIRLTERYLMERFVYGSVQFSGKKSSFGFYTIIQQARLKPSVYVPNFKVLSLDIECSEHGDLYSIGLAANDFQRVLMIGQPQPESPAWITWVADEKRLLQEFVKHVKQYDPDIFVGWSIVNFDFRLLIKRAEKHNIQLALGRDGEPIKWRDARGEVNQGYVSMSGRIVVDGIDALKSATYQFDSYSLEFVSQAFLGKGKQTEDVDNRLDEINHNFKYNKVKLAKYNLQDCILVIEIFEKTKLLQFLTLRSQITGIELDRVGGSVASFLNLYLPKLHRAGYVSPNRPLDGGLASPGGYVMNSMPGLYRHVLVLDFKSLYPSIIRTFKIDPLGLIEGLISPENGIPGYKGAIFSRKKHFLPDIITSLWKQRDKAKKDNDQPRSQAIKILMNSFYGVLGSGGCPFYDTRLASSITLRGHDIMQTTAKWIKEAGYNVIYGDTDSTFVWLDGSYSNEQVREIGVLLQDEINAKWTNLIAESYQLQSHLEIEFEVHFSRFLMPTIRGSKLGSKKRYAGLKSDSSGDELVFKGLETVRSDWTPLAKSFQYTLYSMIFSDKDVKEYIQKVIADTRSGLCDDSLIYRKRLRRKLDKYVKNVPPHVKAARIADAKNHALGKKLQYQYKGWISYVITLNGPEPVEYMESKIDYDHYIEKQIRPIAEGILPFVGLSFEEIANAQMGLF